MVDPGSVASPALLNRDRGAPAAHLAIVTMAYNEAVNLPVWLRHYRRMAPSAKLFVIDHGSDDGSTAELPGVTVIPLPRRELDERDRTFVVNSLQQGLLRYYDVVIYSDCDELLVPDPAVSPNLEAHLQVHRYDYAAAIGINILHIVNSEPPLDFSRPLLRQRHYGQFHSHMCKPLVTRVPLQWEPGFHSCDRPPRLDPALYLFHTKQIDLTEALRRQHVVQRLAWSKGAIEAQHSAHHRYDDERFVREFFHDPANELQLQGARPFTFEAQIARLQQETREVSGRFHVPAFRGPIVEIAEAFRAAF